MPELTHAKIHFNDQGIPFASDFDDVYFSDGGGMAETDYVFLKQNALPQRWQTHPQSAFHIIETGFGTGANFLLTWLRFRQYRRQYPKAHCQRLYFSSVEKYPLSHADLTRALATHSELSELCQLLLDAYPLCVAGCHRLSFDQDTVLLDLWFGDVESVLPQLVAPCDAIYLDGFAPSKNPDMWQQSLFNQLARLSQAGCSVSTFTAAGLVKRGLQQAGFTVTKVKGFGRKREMLTALMHKPVTKTVLPHSEVTIIGGGIASICTALALTQRGIAVHLLCEDAEVASQASQNRQGAVYPNLHANLTDDSQLHAQAFLYARLFYQRWQQQGLDFAMDWCGVVHLASTVQLQQRQDKLISKALWPRELVHAVDADTASAIAGLELLLNGIYYPLAGWLNPQQFCRQALHYLQQQSSFKVSLACQIHHIKRQNNIWLLHSNSDIKTTESLVLACGSKLAMFSQTATLPLNKIRGQVSHVQNSAMAPLKTVLCHKGYITPQWQGLHCVGATFDRNATEAFIYDADNAENLQLVNEQLQQPTWFSSSTIDGAAAAFRATLPDRLPLLGQTNAQDNLYLIGGLGARGIMLSPLLAEALACQICQEPLPLSQQLCQRLSPLRFQAETDIQEPA
ncbi:bifunctional tRNA (5-methylaminomethyl-2-thiouridine)(34)-methyltransferase MnmD/FAD-dependent 5-carboxymethylaminomethyl-2-thiouridine(34) oxidoreductase MnmC [Rheinheimera maricola]|uniref:tRNA 5-methylaminomethyl-2-thiouridine biosynthesis bifunctional protein MnmC n=1 Tax=Rheinheimera maricola TaxID=2793282 RepID=A0ABS7XB48_9GAMM|nr:bifunctional tRNA (5-methylaminomethyl-2-thiouridine)(34)-methyltransferase MnmD/FAD-dependent 5-carboxymethylaminomethyl-2-thiouridine(34) oxidoreductase MnmC [Rheinheimera maricola]MBZ9612781.1 bifunctional tRNA (5-methylaminomethyl-2-thiouridine)(34)-methyltransferase MnmD/FAD-dependent 5-carboxymethylaminomethyl-2-thiouridine(34) oxidoreductase MnmC [Rheinheimera maricola]